MLDRQVRRINRLVVIGTVTVLSLAGQWLYTAARDQRLWATDEQAELFITSVVVFGGMLTLLTALINVNGVLYQLYLAPDLDLLMVAPIPRHIVFGFKLLQCSPGAFLPVMLIGALLTWFGLSRGIGWPYYVLILLLLMSIVVIVTSAVMGLVMLTARVIPTVKLRTWMPVFFVFLPIVVIFGQQWFTAWFASQSDLQAEIAWILLHETDLAVFAGGAVLLELASSLGVYLLFNRSFEEGWNRYREVPATPAQSRSRETWARRLPARLRPVMIKEWLETRRDSSRLLNLLQPAIFVALLLVPLWGQEAVDTLKPILFWFMVFLIPLFSPVVVLGIPLMTILQEGSSFALLKTAPTPMRTVLQGKLYAAWIMMSLPWTAVVVVSGTLLQFSGWQVVILFVTAMLALLPMTTISMGFGALWTNLAASDLKKRFSPVQSYEVIAVNMLYALWVIATMTWVVVHAFPASDSFTVIEVFEDQPVAHMLLSDAVWVPTLLTAGHMAVLYGLLRLWAAAVRRLTQMEL
jgi:hypothetical protein